MPVQKLLLQPGADLQSTPTLNKTKWAATQLVRFYSGLLQKLGGWQRFTTTSVIGTCRALHGWAGLTGIPYLATGTDQRLQVIVGGVAQDVTPLSGTTNNSPNFSTVATSETVTIIDAETPAKVGDWVNLVTQVSVGGLILQGFYAATSVGVGTYTILAATAAASTVANGGAVALFTTTNTSTSVKVTLNNHGLTAGLSTFNVPVSTTVGGIVINGTYSVVTVIDANNFTITGGTAATSGATGSMNAGHAQFQYLIPSGNLNNTGVGYGAGAYGAGAYGQANATSGIATLRIWALDHWGQDLACPTGGQIYYWAPPPAASGPAVVVSGSAPIYNNWIFVVPEVQILMALGAESGGTQYPLLARWCDASDFTDWTPSVSNQAGSFQLNSGSKLIFGAANGLTLYLWTDLGVWSVTYQGLPYIFSFTELARECGAIASNAVAITAIGAVWLSAQGFFQLTGSGVQPMECPVWDYYFNNVDLSQLQVIITALNSQYHEVSWYFPMLNVAGGAAGADTMGYIKWNWVENAWDYGTLTRTAWIDASPVGGPMGVDGAGLVQQHEVGNDADGQAMMPSAVSGYFDLQEGDDYSFVDMIIPDFASDTGANINVTIYSQDYPGGTVKTDGPYLVQLGTTGFFTCASRGRQMAIGIQSADSGSSWRLGALRYRFRPDGKL